MYMHIVMHMHTRGMCKASWRCTCLIGDVFRAIENAYGSLSGGHRGLCHCPLGYSGQSTPASTAAAYSKKSSAYRRIPLIQQVASECESAAIR